MRFEQRAEHGPFGARRRKKSGIKSGKKSGRESGRIPGRGPGNFGKNDKKPGKNGKKVGNRCRKCYGKSGVLTFARLPSQRLQSLPHDQRKHHQGSDWSAHHQPRTAFRPRPRSVVAESQAQTMLSWASARSARLPRLAATRSFPRARSGITIKDRAVRTMPIRLDSGRLPVTRTLTESVTM